MYAAVPMIMPALVAAMLFTSVGELLRTVLAGEFSIT